MVNNLVFKVAKTFMFHAFGGSWYVDVYRVKEYMLQKPFRGRYHPGTNLVQFR